MTDQTDPKALIVEAYRIDGIGAAECRSILVDWALSLADGVDAQQAIAVLHAQYGQGNPDHPMTAVLREGLGPSPVARRRGGGRARRGGSG